MRYIEECKLLNYNCNTDQGWNLAVMHFHYALTIAKKITALIQSKGINDFKFQCPVRW